MTGTTERTIAEEALEFFLENEALRFGDFTLKSGRSSPYFFNTGSLSGGQQLGQMGVLYGRAIKELECSDEIDLVFGSAYKGIPISIATTLWLSFGEDMAQLRALSDRKEAKTHGDKGGFLGRYNEGERAVIVDDVITDGATKREAIEKLRNVGIVPRALVIAFDRQEPVVAGGKTAVEVFAEEMEIPVRALLTVDDIITARPDLAETLRAHLATFA